MAARGQRGKPQLAGGLPQGDRDLIALKMFQNRDKVTAQEAEGSVKPQHESGAQGY